MQETDGVPLQPLGLVGGAEHVVRILVAILAPASANSTVTSVLTVKIKVIEELASTI